MSAYLAYIVFIALTVWSHWCDEWVRVDLPFKVSPGIEFRVGESTYTAIAPGGGEILTSGVPVFVRRRDLTK